MADVFISYSQRAPEPTVSLAASLIERGFAPTYDVNLLPGDVFGAVIDTEIDTAKAVITIWSMPALTSTWVPAESRRAHDQKKLISVRTDEVDPRRLPTPFNATHAPLYTDVDGIVAKLGRLGVRPSGVDDVHLTAEDILTRQAARDWRNHVSTCEVIAEVEAFLHTYRTLPMYKRIAQGRLDQLRSGGRSAAAPSRPTLRIVRPEDVLLRLDPEMHTAPINRIAATKDARVLATGSDDKSVRLWSLPDGNPIRTLRPQIGEGNEGKVFAVAIDPNGRWVAAGGWLSTSGGVEFVSIFDAETGEVTAQLGPLPNVVLDLEVSADGRRLAAALHDGGIRVWTLTEGVWSEPAVDRVYGGAVYGLAYANDGRLASTCEDGHIRLYAPDMQLIAKVAGTGGKDPYGLAFNADGTHLAVGYYDTSNVTVFDGANLSVLWPANVGGIVNGDLSKVAWLSNNRLAACGRYSDTTDNHVVCVWEDAGRGQRTAWQASRGSVMDLITLPATGGLAFGAAEPSFGLLTDQGERILWRQTSIANLRAKRAEHFMCSPDGKKIRFGLERGGGRPYLFDLDARKFTPSPTPPNGLQQADIKRLKIEHWMNDQSPFLVQGGGLVPTKSIPILLEQFEYARALAIAPDGKNFVLGCDWSLRWFNDAGKQLWTRANPGTAWGVHLARRGRLILAAYGDGTIRWHRASDGKELLALFMHIPPDQGAEVQWIVFTPAGYYDCSPGADSLIGWHLNRGDREPADFYPVDTFATTFKRPDIVSAALNTV